MTKKIHPAKAAVVSTLSDLLKLAKSVAIVDYRGLKVSQATQLRQAIKSAGGRYVVAKNTLFKIAALATNRELPTLDGISGFVFSLNDEVAALKAVADFAKKNSIPTFKSGFLGDRVLSLTEVTSLAYLPDRTTNYQLLTANLNSPISRLVSVLGQNISKLVNTLNAIKSSKEVN
ncbi:50S ribosomal protein L10 [Candidatus Amesbacteria bacterium RIFCSPLOWO2_02_FULL_48_11]|uniref:Large ribosomal subunit protein uL10 n=4 Tax=Candidatus Amesiibacteriota TaxID=1752730 RepID=A0A1F4Z6G0_9BACT|nr:MAG: 50S ribosomal protein L10 [Candidatus Amesbacteria bacterium GW2011_GWA2_47_11]KKU92955.1 MAG: 50S ribosomal protein L10 [Candidatus Amesbacteria bacterium GW2011_GWC1_48_10]KKU99159.1 MAG: 50S ribosomal protein L10 [Candidatus Amesbacteria bacterium GW2011_GWA1_48_9]OGC90707.1 MAG: 50S ribosomal protein L10 [Candidatus Amesbacteria bacterium RBG_19FT_COMBO_48_16]OGC97166.1 MAG: 50S ribosomal protein L10 [Candidatus Amesbacteria bacterium RIFCSPHIGHO2_02_FULL_48_21]OGC98083.1 MAG: 50S 